MSKTINSFKVFGRKKTWAFLSMALPVTAFEMWLYDQIAWPRLCARSPTGRGGGPIIEMVCSPYLLTKGWHGLGFFLAIWLPVIALVVVGRIVARHFPNSSDSDVI